MPSNAELIGARSGQEREVDSMIFAAVSDMQLSA
jgi:hypothetical protein